MAEALEHGSSLDEPIYVGPDVLHIPVADIPDVWPRVGPMFQVFETMEPQRYSTKDLFTQLMQSYLQLHLVYDGRRFNLALLTQFLTYPQARVCQIMYASGEDVDRVMTLYPQLEAWAREQGADEIELWGRPGWERKLKPIGFDKRVTVLWKRIEDDVATTS